ncbi:hypothetical protein D3C85_374750 [compost metagenome]
MHISKNSWHFRFLNKWEPSKARRIKSEGTTLCSYFWLIVWELLLVTLVALTALVVCASLCFILLYAPVAAFLFGLPDLVAPATIGLIVWSMTLGSLAYEWYKRSSKRHAVVKEPGLVRSYVRARKDKFCPIVKVV